MKNHLKRLRAPRFWKISKKEAKWATKPRAGPHGTFKSIPLLVVVRDILKLADDAKEAKSIIKMNEIFVDGSHRNDHKYPVGIMDIVSVPKMKRNFIVLPTGHGLELVEIAAKDAKEKLCKIEGKRSVKGGKVQLNLHDGGNALVDEKDAPAYSTGDSISLDLDKKGIKKHIKLAKGHVVIVTEGKNMGKWGRVEELVVTKTKEPTKVICDMDGEKMEVIKDYIFVIGEKEPILKV